MKNLMKKAVATLICASCLLSAVSIGVLAAEESKEIRIECETAEYTATKADGRELVPLKKDASLIYFSYGNNDPNTKVELGDKITYPVDVETAGTYSVTVAYRINENYYSTVQVSVNDDDVGNPFSTSTTPGNSNKIVSTTVGEAEFVAGNNTVTLEIVGEAEKASQTTQLVLDYISLTMDTGEFTLPYRIEAEDTPFTVTDSNGVTADKSNDSKWAWSLNLGISESKPSGALTYFRSGGIGGTVDFKVDVPEAGNYGLTWGYRPNDTSYSAVQVLVNGKEVGGIVSQQTGKTVGGVVNEQNIIRTVVLGNADFTEGENIITFKMVDIREDNDLSKSGFTIDYIDLTAPVDESGLAFTEGYEKLVLAEGVDYKLYYQTRKGSEDGTTDYRLLVVADKDYLATLESATIVVTFSDGSIEHTLKHTVRTAYNVITAKGADGNTTVYIPGSGAAIMGCVISGVPDGYEIGTVEFQTVRS